METIHVIKFQSPTFKVLTLKVGIPIFLSFGIYTFFFSNGTFAQRVISTIPMLAAFVFFISLVSLRVQNGIVSYRHVLRWIVIDPNELRGSGILWPNTIGYVRLGRPVLPFGRIFFVLDTCYNLGRTPDKNDALIEFLRSGPESEGPSSKRM